MRPVSKSAGGRNFRERIISAAQKAFGMADAYGNQ
jgi:hypothetical protein